MNQKLTILKQYWKYESFRPGQEDIIDAVLAGHDVLALLPTGGGKSICFQVPAMIKEGVCIVITPLIALMQDQVEQLNRRGIKAIAINASMTSREIDIKLDSCLYGDIKFLYCSPERLKTDIFLARLSKMKIGLLAIDEAHCISQWGYDFRPAYLEIATIRAIIPDVNIIALTATATEEVKVDIQDKLAFKNSKIFQKSFARFNLSYAVREVEHKEKKLVEVLKRVPGSAIVYANSRKGTKEMATMLYKNGISADFYHAGLTFKEREQKQLKWIKNQTRVMVATNAFGMGIDKPDVRLVVHVNLTQDLESYYQEAGRAGRDERKAYALILYNKADIAYLKDKHTMQFPTVDLIKRVYQSLANYYKLAVGSGGDQAFDFDIHDFSESYKLNHLEVFYTLKKLEEEGILLFNESYYQPSQLMITVDNKALYEFQIANARYDPLIKIILRIYGGELFNNFLKISEVQIAKALETSEVVIKEALLKLHQLNIFHYNPTKDNPQVVFVAQRYSSDQLPLNLKRRKERETLSLKKMESVIGYVQNTHRCRTALLLDYFGEHSFDKCGICDTCINQKKEGHQIDIEEYRHQIIHHLTIKPMVIEDLAEVLNPKDKEEFMEVIRIMVDANELSYDEHWQLMMAAQAANKKE